MLALSLRFPARRFHATPWDRQVNEGAVEWPPSPWRLLRSLVATWHHKFPDVPEEQIRQLVDSLSSPPLFHLPKAFQAHLRHYMPTVTGNQTKVFDTFVVVDPADRLHVVWPDLSLDESQRQLLDRLLKAMSYFGRAESWVDAEIDPTPQLATDDALPVEPGVDPPPGRQLVRTLAPKPAADIAEWATQTRQAHVARRLDEINSKAAAKGKPTKKTLPPRDMQAIEASVPGSLFDALHAESALLRSEGWNQPPGSRWINYIRPETSFLPADRPRPIGGSSRRPTLARFALAGPVLPRLTDALRIGERARHFLMGCSRKIEQAASGDATAHAAVVFSGKNPDGSPLADSHRHAHYLCEARDDGRIAFLNVYALRGFSKHDELALGRFSRMWGDAGHDLQVALLGVGDPADFGGLDTMRGQSPLFAQSAIWRSSTPLVPTRHLKLRLSQADHGNSAAAAVALDRELTALARLELFRRGLIATDEDVEVETLLDRPGTNLGGTFTSWLKFQRSRSSGGGRQLPAASYGVRLMFREPVRGPIALGASSHFGLGLFVAE
jgi:CRISPR-associated protein Csb2